MVDTKGELYGELEFNDVVELKDAMLDRPEIFMRAFCEHLLSYALGRELTAADKPAVDKIVETAVADRGQFSSVIHAIVTSDPFLKK
ncbi:MAG: DUF1585 domain-containing protein [Verrucomicrobiota bacterium]